MNYTLSLIRTKEGNLLLEGRCPGETLEYYAVDGEGGPATSINFAPWNQAITYVHEVETADYEGEDTESFWNALTTVLQSARDKGIELPDYNALDQ